MFCIKLLKVNQKREKLKAYTTLCYYLSKNVSSGLGCFYLSISTKLNSLQERVITGE